MLLTIAFAAVLSLPQAPAEEHAFRELSLPQATELAAREEKIVMIDFYTTWCPPCKELDRTTWKNVDVIAWLRDNSIAIKIDAEKELEVAKQYKLTGYPTLVFVRPGEGELDRHIGYLSAEAFIATADAILAGKDSVQRAKDALEGHETDPMQRMQLGDAQFAAGRHAEALADYLWCFDEGLKHNPSFGGVRVSFLLGDIEKLSKVYPPARDAMLLRRDNASKIILNACSIGQTDVHNQILEFTALNRHLGQPESNLKLLDSLLPLEGAELVRELFVSQIVPQLVDANRALDLLQNTRNLSLWLDDQIERTRRMASFRLRNADPRIDYDHIAAITHKRTLTTALHYYQALLSLGEKHELDHPGVEEFEQKLLSFDSSADCYALLIRHAGQAGSLSDAKRLEQLALKNLPEQDHKKIRRELVRQRKTHQPPTAEAPKK